jgi:predicted DsbA family dithiol-disulfide isomerase
MHTRETEPSMSNATSSNTTPLTVEIWSDVLCPFCYIGKREFEQALSRFEHQDQVTIDWKSFELDTNAPVRSEEDTYSMLARKYGMTREEAKARSAGVAERAASLGLQFNMDKAVIANSFDAHRLIQFAKSQGLGDAAEERLFKAYFTDGVCISDHNELVKLGAEIGLDAAAVRAMLASDAYTEAVRTDQYEAQQFGIRGVPYFTIDRKFAVSGAQSADHFLGALQHAWRERSTAAVNP